VSRRPQVLFLLALLGVLAALGTVVADLLGPGAAVGYAVVVVALLVVGAGRARAVEARRRAAAGHTCTCCTSSQHDPVRVV
jgi:hypothetical protein